MVDPRKYLVEFGVIEYDRAGGRAEQTLRVAVAALLCEMMHIDEEMDVREFQEVIRLLGHEFKLMDDEAAELREVAEFLLKDREKVFEFIEIINQNYSRDQREYILGLVRKIAIADNTLDKYETSFLQMLRTELKLETT